MSTPKDDKALTSFRESKWRYSQFVVFGLVVALVVKWLSSFGWAASLLIGAAVGAGYYWLERRRGVI
jgi:hypothetical protein